MKHEAKLWRTEAAPDENPLTAPLESWCVCGGWHATGQTSAQLLELYLEHISEAEVTEQAEAEENEHA